MRKWINRNHSNTLNVAKQKGRSFISQFVIYSILTAIAYIFLYPLMRMFSTSVKSLYDQVNPLVIWFPETLYWENYRKAWISLGQFDTFLKSLANIGAIALIQTISSAMIGYGIAKFKFWWTRLTLVFIVILFIFPREITLLPQYVIMSQQNLVNSIWPVVLLSAFGQGTKNAIYILVFFSFFNMQPKSLDEASFVDGAGYFRTFFKINIPMAVPAFVVNFIFSFVWNWNDTTVSGRFFGGRVKTVQLALEQFQNLYNSNFPYDTSQSPLERMNYGVEMAGAILAILPLIIAYFIVQRYIVEGIDQSGITGE